MSLEIPNVAGATERGGTLAAALEYANHGWYILPVGARTKHPGSIVGAGWPALSSRDPKIITAWFAGADHGIALHAGRSGAVVLDVDEPDNMPDEILAAIETTNCPYQSTRPDRPGRGHYPLLNTTERRIGNGLGKLATPKKWGEIRGANGVIIVEPSTHPEGGIYQWQRIGVLPPIPEYIAEALPESSEPEGTATDVEVEAFLAIHIVETGPEALIGLRNALQRKLDQGQSCHMSTLGVLTDAMAEAATGRYSARRALNEIWNVYEKTVLTGTSTGRVLTKYEARDQYRGIAAWAIGQVKANTAAAGERLAKRYGEPKKVTPEDVLDTENRASCGELEGIENGFWESRESLKLIQTAALSQLCAPWAVLACCTARILALTPPSITLPPVIGGRGTLNWFGAIVAKSGGGKGAASAVAAQLVNRGVFIRSAGSGEGMIEAYNRAQPPEDHISSILFSVDEVDTLASLRERSGQTTMQILRQGFSGETLSFSYRGRSKEQVDAHTYRMTLIVAVQPERAGGLFSDSGGGTPQRFMWFPGRDRRITADPEGWPVDAQGVFRTIPIISDLDLARAAGTITIPAQAVRTIRQARADSMRGDDNALDGHALFCREKFAYALALFDGRAHMTLEDWELSGIASRVSDWCRVHVQEVLEGAAHQEALLKGELLGAQRHEADVARDRARQHDLERIVGNCVKHVREAGGRLKRYQLRKKLVSRDRPLFDDALMAAVAGRSLLLDGDEVATL